MNKYKMYMYMGIMILILSTIGSTYAYYRFVMTSVNVNTITRGLDYYINYAKGTDITSGTLNPSKDYTGGNNITVTLNKKDNTYNIYGHIYLDISNISTALSSSNALKYVVLEGATKISEGVLGEVSSGESYLLAVNIPLKTTTTTYTIYLWFDEASSNALSAENTSVSAKVRCEATMQEIDDFNYTSFASLNDKLTRLYQSGTKSNVNNNNITYQYNTTNSLMKDVENNIRYYGTNPNNYIYFNCSDYSNQTDSTCEKWRIIGLNISTNEIKLIRASSIGTYSFDNRGTSSGAETVYGSNNWTIARLMLLLNPGHNTETGGSLYWNGLSDNCYSGSNAVDNIRTCDLSSVGLKNDITRNLIKEHTYSLLGFTSTSLFANEAYEQERVSGSVYKGRPTTWTGKIALMYPSDYGYSADLSVNVCSSVSLSGYYSCRNYNWLYAGAREWILTPKSGFAAKNNIINTDANVTFDLSAYGEYNVRPVLYISSSLYVNAGDGTSSNPYKLSLN